MNIQVCSFSISACETFDLEASDLDAYGVRLDDANEFLGDARANGERNGTQ